MDKQDVINIVTQFMSSQPFQDYIVSIMANALAESVEIKKADQRRRDGLPKDKQEQESLERRFDAALEVIKKRPEMLEEYLEICERKDL